MRSSDTTELADFLSSHETVFSKGTFADGSRLGAWRVLAFLGRGGSGEVYRVENDATRKVAALKIHVAKAGATDDERAAARRRFCREAEFLKQNRFPFFPKFFDAGEAGGRPFFVMELLETREFPSQDRPVAAFLLKVCLAARTLHRRGLVHRDIKPSNILWRGDEPVLIDLGLLKETADATRAEGRTGVSVTVVDGRAVGAGTPGFAAPEQFGGGVLSPATDIHALGVLIDECFLGCPPRAWNRIVRRATSSLPGYRYHDVEAMMRTIRWRHAPFAAGCFGVVAAVAFAAFAYFTWVRPEADLDPMAVRKAIDVAERTEENKLWQSLCKYGVTNGAQQVVTVNVKDRHLVFRHPLPVYPGPVWRIVGRGVLDATLERRILSERGVVTVELENCFLVNRTLKTPADAAVRYVFCRGGCLNFINQKDEEQENRKALFGGYVEGYDGGASNGVYFKPTLDTLADLASQRNFDYYRDRVR